MHLPGGPAMLTTVKHNKIAIATTDILNYKVKKINLVKNMEV